MPVDLNIMPKPPEIIQTPGTMRPTPPMREFGDAKATRHNIYSNTLKAVGEMEPFTDGTHTLRLTGVDWVDPDRFPRKDRKQALLSGETLARRLRGTWELSENATGNVLQRRQQIVARVPYMSSMGTFTHRGTDYTINHQKRLMPGVYAREKENGELESHFNILPGKGVGHRYFLDPTKGVFKIKMGQAEMPLMPLLQAMGTTDREIRDHWGDALWQANAAHNDSGTIRKLASKLLREQPSDSTSMSQQVAAAFNRMELDPEVTQRTLGTAHKNVTKEAILAATKKLLAISRKEMEPDDRDHMAYQQILGPEDLFAERLRRDHGHIRRALFRKILREKSLDKMPSGALTRQLEQLLIGSGLAQSLEEINPLEVLDKQSRITSMGEGGIGSLEAIPEDSRMVHPSQMGFLDPIRTPESLRVGIDLNLARAARKGTDGRIYTQLRGRDGRLVWRSPQDVAESTVATPDVLGWDTPLVPVMRSGKLAYVPKDKIDYVVPEFEGTFSHIANLVPFKSAMKQQRLAMGSRMLTQALSLHRAQAPFVQAGMPGSMGNRSFDEEYGRHAGAVRADKSGRVMKVEPGLVKVKYDDGTTDDVELYHNHPFNRKSFIHQTTKLKPGDTFQKGDLLARSNYTDDSGTIALGTNLRTAYYPYHGHNIEDAIVISESAAREKLSSEHAYQHDLELTDKHKLGKKTFTALFPSKFNRDTLERLDENGLVRPGTQVNNGDPLILVAKERDRSQAKIHRKGQPAYNDESVLWEHEDPGIVTDVVIGKNGPVVMVKSLSPAQEGDKLSGRFGDKGVIGKIVPDDQMPHDKDGQPFEILLNPAGVPTRGNPVQNIEAWLGKIAAKTGKPFKVPDFENQADLAAWAQQQLRQHGLADTEDVYDPKYGTRVPGVQTGIRYIMKLHHQSEAKEQGRGAGAYSSEDAPAKGGTGGSKRVAVMNINALLSHGAIGTLRDIRLVRGQRNDQHLLQFMNGFTPSDPHVPLAYEKYINQLKSAGLNVIRDGPRMNIMAMTDKDVDELAGDRDLLAGDTVHFDHDLRPVKGGLFDEQLTGGHAGRRWSALRLPEAYPNPVMEEPIRRVLGLTQKKFNDVIGGKHVLPGYGSGPGAIAKALGRIDLDREIDAARHQWRHGRGATRDAALRKWEYLEAARKHELHPRDWMLSRVPVLPPAFRPVSELGATGMPLVADANYLYKELFEAVRNHDDLKKELGENNIGQERQAIYDSFKAVTGLGDPVHPKLIEKNITGVLKSILGSSPKFSTIQRKLLSTTVDNVGRAVIVPNPDYDMNTIGIPEGRAFDVYQKFIVRRLRRRGMPLRDALREVRDKTPLARQALEKEMDERPVYADRAPVLHKFGVMAFKPKLVRGHNLQMNTFVLKGYNADFDGDMMNFHVPTTDEAVKEAYERLLPSRSLLSPADFKTPVFAPINELVGGLHAATSRKSSRRLRVFRNRQDALGAYARGDIGVHDPIQILES